MRAPAVVRWIWAAPAVFAVHDGEELLTMVPWLCEHRASLPELMRPYAEVSVAQLALAMLALLGGLVATTWYGANQLRRGLRPTVFLLLAGALVGNGVSHLGQAVAFRGYVPGLVTALLIVLPYGLVLGRQLSSAGVLSGRRWIGFVALGIALQLPIIWATLLLARR